MWLVVVIIVIVVIWAYSSSKDAERKREYEEARQKRERIAHIKKDYPNAYAEYWGKEVDPSPYYLYHGVMGRYSKTNFRKANESFTDLEWTELEKRVKSRKEAETKEKEAKEWENAQNAFASKMRNLAGEKLPTYGNYTYTYNITTKGGTGLSMKIWQHFTYEVCLERDLDYTYNQLALDNTNSLQCWKEKGLILSEQYQKQIEEFIADLAYGKKVVLLCNENVDSWTDNALSTTYAHIKKPDSVKKINVILQRSLGLECKSGIEQLVQESPDCVVVIDAFTTNEQLKKNCESIFNALQDNHSNLAYISLVKAYDRSEMIAYIERSKVEAERSAAEAKEKEEERKRKEEKRVKLSLQAPAIFAENVKSWEHLYGNFYYNYLFYYYPTNIPNFEATQEEWWNRRNVWDFKNDPEKNILPEDHEITLKEIIPQIKQKLSETFGEEYLQFLTLACLPASTKVKNIARYEEFSNRLCAETGMINGYPYITIVKDGLPRHETGLSAPPEVTIADWFYGKYVLLFDDVITRGRTMLRYKEILERKGAIIVGGFTLGKTKHERPTQGGVSSSSTQPFPPQPTTFSDNDFELPF